MSQGYSGRRFFLTLDGVRIAAVRTKGGTFTREPIDTTTDDDDGWRELLGEPGRRAVDANVAGVMTAQNAAALLSEWEGNVNSDVELELPDGREVSAAEGFFLGNLEFGGEETGPTTFSAQLQSSGEVSIGTASS